jgi:hypothetical protein
MKIDVQKLHSRNAGRNMRAEIIADRPLNRHLLGGDQMLASERSQPRDERYEASLRGNGACRALGNSIQGRPCDITNHRVVRHLPGNTNGHRHVVGM